METSLQVQTVIWGEDNIIKSYFMEKGNVDDVWEKAAFIVEGEYSTGAQEQLYIEPNGMIAEVRDGTVNVWGSMQCPFYVQKALTELMGLPARRSGSCKRRRAGRSAGRKVPVRNRRPCGAAGVEIGPPGEDNL